MALSKSLSQEQIQITCQLCEIPNKKIIWKCKDCDLLMCGNCRENIHSKVKTSGDHQIMNITDIGTKENGENENVILSNIKCKTHQHQTCCLFCKECSKVVCPICITDAHNGHKLQNLIEAYDEKIKHSNDRQEQIILMLEEIGIREKELTEIESDRHLKHREAKQAIQIEKEILVETMNRSEEELFEQLDRELETSDLYVDREKRQLEKSKVSLIERRENALKLNSFVQILEHQLVSDNELLQTRTDKGYNISHFVPATTKFLNLGTLKTETMIALQKTPMANVIMKVEKKAKTELRSIHSIVICNDNPIWIADSKNGILQKVVLGEEDILILLNIQLVVFSMVVVPSGDILLATGDSVLKNINPKTGKQTNSIYSVYDQIITAVHLTEKNELIIGSRSKGIRYAPEGSKVLIAMNLDRGNSKGNVGVVDWLSDAGNGRVVILSPTGGILHTYDGQPEAEISLFGGIVATKEDNFIVNDAVSHILHILNSDGEYVCRFDTTSIGIKLPCCLAFSESGKLYIGSVNMEEQPNQIICLD
ncbi:Hypothetical predicted protein [Mytilus galloprovincialis]|uniref:B box-type domain-containing protein n=1 Tax=Mytilus galloprovincialis TaxID=29158 RepID=A0A8B6FTY6_MYTGA|nr:Hypothetical predicted protein [Mytilus galloprovincialis]